MKEEYKALRAFLDALPTGPVGDTDELARHLANAWHGLEGSDSTRMAAYKVGRMENARWDPPHLTFEIERHVYAEMQRWRVNIEQRTAEADEWPGRKRLVGERQPPIHVGPIVSEIVEAIVAGADDRRLRWWKEKNRVRIEIGRIFPAGSAVKETLTGRRRRFGRLAEEELAQRGWRRIQRRFYTYERN